MLPCSTSDANYEPFYFSGAAGQISKLLSTKRGCGEKAKQENASDGSFRTFLFGYFFTYFCVELVNFYGRETLFGWFFSCWIRLKTMLGDLNSGLAKQCRQANSKILLKQHYLGPFLLT